MNYPVLLHCNVHVLVIFLFSNQFSVKPEKVKFDWEHPSIEENYGHTQSEWGKSITNNKKEPFVIYAYKMKWEIADY